MSLISPPRTMRFRFASWNVNNRILTVRHLDLLRQASTDILALQEVSARFHAALTASDLFGWSASSLALRPHQEGEGRSRRLGCSLFGREPLRLADSSLVPGLVFPERALVARLVAPGHRVTACSFHTPPGASWGEVKPQTLKAIARWLASQSGPLIVGIDANTPKTDHPDLSRSEWWWPDEALLLGPAPLHGLKDALRLHLDAHSEVLAHAVATRPNGPLAVSHVRGNGRKRTECRYDFIYVSPGVRVHHVEYVFDQSVRSVSDHALVVADLELRGPNRQDQLPG